MPSPESRTPNPELRDAVGKLAQATWQRFQVFCRQAEKEASELRKRLEQAAAGTLPRPKTIDECLQELRAKQSGGTPPSPDLETGNSKIETGLPHQSTIDHQPSAMPSPESRTPNPEEEPEEPEPEPQWLVEKLIWAFLFSEPEQAFQAAEQCNRRVGEAFRGLEEALQKALDEEDSRQ